MRYPDAAPARRPQKQARAGGELATPDASASPGAPALTVSRHGRARGCGAAARGWGTHAAPGRARSRQAPRARGPATRTDAPAARPRRAAPRPVVAPAGFPPPQPSLVGPQPGLTCPALPCPPRSSFPPKDKAASNLAHSSPGTLPALFAPLHTWFLVSLVSIHSGLVFLSSRVDPEPQLIGAKQGNRWERAARSTQVPPGFEARDSPVAPRFVPEVKIELSNSY